MDIDNVVEIGFYFMDADGNKNIIALKKDEASPQINWKDMVKQMVNIAQLAIIAGNNSHLK